MTTPTITSDHLVESLARQMHLDTTEPGRRATAVIRWREMPDQDRRGWHRFARRVLTHVLLELAEELHDADVPDHDETCVGCGLLRRADDLDVPAGRVPPFLAGPQGSLQPAGRGLTPARSPNPAGPRPTLSTPEGQAHVVAGRPVPATTPTP